MQGNPSQNITKDSEHQGVISSSTRIHAAIGFLIVVLLTLVQVMYQNKEKSPFESHSLIMKLFTVATFIYTLVMVAVITLQARCCFNYLPLLKQICLISGALACDSLLMILAPPFAYFVFVLCLLLLLRLAVCFHKQILELLCHFGKLGFHLLTQLFGFLVRRDDHAAQMVTA